VRKHLGYSPVRLTHPPGEHPAPRLRVRGPPVRRPRRGGHPPDRCGAPVQGVSRSVPGFPASSSVSAPRRWTGLPPAESGRVLSVPGGIIAASHHEAQEAGDQST